MGTTFLKAVPSNSNLFLEVYTSWCSHCKVFAEEYAELAAEFVDVPALVIGKIDVSDVP